MPTLHGSCHCQGVRFELDAAEPLSPYFRCDCSLCSRKGTLLGQALASELRITHGEDLLSVYRWNTREAAHFFCKVCGIHTHHVMRGATECIGVNMACIDGFDVFAVGEVDVGNGARLDLVPTAADPQAAR